jgi:hypothetical protein
MASLSFDATTVAPQQEFLAIPAGVYIARIVESEVLPTKNNNGTLLKLQFDIIEGQFTNRKIFERINIQNTNPEAEKIGQSQLSQLCHAVNVLQLNDTEMLHNKPVRIKVKIRKDDTGQYGDQNSISAYEAVGNGVNAAPAFAAPKPAAQKPASTAPWAQK